MTHYHTIFLADGDAIRTNPIANRDADVVAVEDVDGTLVDFHVRRTNAAIALKLADALRAVALKHLPQEGSVTS